MNIDYKIALIGFFGAILAAVIGLVQFGKDPDLKVIDVTSHLLSFSHGTESISLIDLKIKNSGEDASFIKRAIIKPIEIERLDAPIPSCGISGCHETLPSAVYTVDFAKLSVGENAEMNVSHTVEANNTDRLVLSIGAEKSALARVVVEILADEDTSLKSKPLDVLIIYLL